MKENKTKSAVVQTGTDFEWSSRMYSILFLLLFMLMLVGIAAIG